MGSFAGVGALTERVTFCVKPLNMERLSHTDSWREKQVERCEAGVCLLCSGNKAASMASRSAVSKRGVLRHWGGAD